MDSRQRRKGGRRPSAKGLIRRRLLLVGASILAGLLLFETGYRCFLWLRLKATVAHPSYGVMNQPLYEFSLPFGYAYARGRTVVCVDIVDGTVKACRDIQIDADGNLDSGTPSGTDSVTVLIFGDSFTANPHQPLGWPRYFAEKSGFRVTNFARDGYGLTQMFHLAADRAKELRPDFIIMAFIVDDVSRDRIWRSTVDVQGQPMAVVSTDPGRLDDPSVAMEMSLIDPAVSHEWFDAVHSGSHADDPVLRRLNDRFRSIAMRRQGAWLRRLDRSLVVNTLSHRDPYFGMQVPSRNPRMNRLFFEDDPQMVRDVQSIDVPMVLILLPRYEEMQRRQLMGSRQMISLLGSLNSLTGLKTILLLDHMTLDDVNLESLFLLPEDIHPSPAGSEAYADAILRYLRESGALDSLRN